MILIAQDYTYDIINQILLNYLLDSSSEVVIDKGYCKGLVNYDCEKKLIKESNKELYASVNNKSSCESFDFTWYVQDKFPQLTNSYNKGECHINYDSSCNVEYGEGIPTKANCFWDVLKPTYWKNELNKLARRKEIKDILDKHKRAK